MFGLTKKEKHERFVTAIVKNDPDEFYKLLKSGIDPNTIYNNAAFMQYVASSGNKDFMKAMIDAGARLRVFQCVRNETEVFYDVINPYIKNEMINFLLDTHPDAASYLKNTHPGGDTPLSRVSDKGVFEALVNGGEKLGNPNPALTPSPDGRYCLIQKAIDLQVSTEVLKKVIHGTTDLNQLKPCYLRDQVAIIHYAVAKDKLDVVDFLKAQGADIFMTDANGCTAMHYVRSIAMAQKLLDFGLDINMPDHQGRTPIFNQFYGGGVDVFNFMVKNGANVHHLDHKNRSTLMEAAAHGSDYKIRELLRLGVSAETLDSNGASIFSYIDSHQSDNFKGLAREELTRFFQEQKNNKREEIELASAHPNPPEQLVPQKDNRFERLTDVTLLVRNGGGLSTVFNFATGQTVEMKDGLPYLTQNFNALGRREVIEEMRQKLVELGGHPPAGQNVVKISVKTPAETQAS